MFVLTVLVGFVKLGLTDSAEVSAELPVSWTDSVGCMCCQFVKA